MKVLRTVVIVLAIAFAFTYGVYQWQGGQEGLVSKAIPQFPDFPAPYQQLNEGQSGDIYFASSTPFDFDVLLNDPQTGIASTGLGNESQQACRPDGSLSRTG